MQNLLKKRRQAKIDSKAAKSKATKLRYINRVDKWTELEHKACMKAVKKYGTNYELIAEEIKARSKEQIRCRLKWLISQVKTDKHHPDRATLLEFKKKKRVCKAWTA